MKKYLLLLPEFFIIALSIYWFLENYMSSGYINYFAIVVFAIVTLQVFLKNKIVGIILGSVFLFLGLYMILAVISEYRKFTIVDSSAIQLLTVGLSICFVIILSSIALFYKSILKSF